MGGIKKKSVSSECDDGHMQLSNYCSLRKNWLFYGFAFSMRLFTLSSLRGLQHTFYPLKM